MTCELSTNEAFNGKTLNLSKRAAYDWVPFEATTLRTLYRDKALIFRSEHKTNLLRRYIMESRTEDRFSSDRDETIRNDRRDFLSALVAAALMASEASETANAQQTSNAGPSAGGGPGSLRQRLPAPFTGMDAAFAQLTIRPGAPASRPHTHSGFVLGYVIEGDYLFAINNETPRVVHAGEIFYEPPGATHTAHASAQPDQTVKLLAIVIGPQDAATTSPLR
jgi:quercetin dioxygenase-like cupin family protein